jgi:hypothetical protein
MNPNQLRVLYPHITLIFGRHPNVFIKGLLERPDKTIDDINILTALDMVEFMVWKHQVKLGNQVYRNPPFFTEVLIVLEPEKIVTDKLILEATI